MPLFQRKPHRSATNSAEHPAVLRELHRLYQKKTDTVMEDIRFSAILSPHYPHLASDLSRLGASTLPQLFAIEQLLQIQAHPPQEMQKPHNVPQLSAENAHAVAHAYCKKRLLAAQAEQVDFLHLKRFAASNALQELLDRIAEQAGEDIDFLLHTEKMLARS